MSTITRDQWLKALTEAEDNGDPSAVTVVEFGALVGVQRFAAQKRLHLLVEKGLAERTYKYTLGVNGRVKVPAYRLVKPEPKRKGK